MSGQVSRGLAGDYQSDERAGVARLSVVHGCARKVISPDSTGRGQWKFPIWDLSIYCYLKVLLRSLPPQQSYFTEE